MLYRLRSAVAVLFVSGLGLAATGCGPGTHDPSPGASSSTRAAAPPMRAPPGATPLSSSSGSSAAAGPGTGDGSPPPADLAAVESDEDAVGAATDQSDNDFNAAIIAATQNDSP
jgi:hypothetical protein